MAPVACMLSLTLAYQNEIAMCDTQITSITNKQYRLTRQTTALAEDRQDKLSEVSQDDPQYMEKTKAIKEDFKKQERELAALEDQMTMELDNWQTKRSMAQKYLEGFQGGLQSGLQSSFQPFPGQ